MSQPAEISTKPLLIVCDTCIYVKDFALTNGDWTKIRAILKTHTDAKLVLPKAVEQEVLNKLEELSQISLQNAENEISKAQKRLINLGVNWSSAKKNLNREIKKYSDKIKGVTEKRLLRTPMPKISVEEFFRKAMHGSRPFKMHSSDGGYKRAVNGFRDAVIWESVKEIYRTHKGSSVIFYTTNATDFADAKSKNIHPQFWSEILEIRKNGKGFHFVQEESGLDSFLKEAEVVAGVEDKIRNFIEDHRDEVANALSSPEDEFYSEYENELTVQSFELRSLKIENFYEESDTSTLVEATGEFEVEAEFFMSKSDYNALAEGEEDKLSVLDTDWNDHVMLVGKIDIWNVNVLATIPSQVTDGLVSQITINGEQIGEGDQDDDQD